MTALLCPCYDQAQLATGSTKERVAYADPIKIIDNALGGLMKRLSNLKIALTLTDDAKEFVAEKGYDPQFGARPLHRAIQKYIEDPLAEFILNENPGEGVALQATLNDDKSGLVIAFEADKKKAKQKESTESKDSGSDSSLAS